MGRNDARLRTNIGDFLAFVESYFHKYAIISSIWQKEDGAGC